MDPYRNRGHDKGRVDIQSERKECTFKVFKVESMDISTVIQLTWIATSWELLAERDVLDALMPTCWHVLWLWWHHQLQGSD